jgi:hypothetical protein
MRIAYRDPHLETLCADIARLIVGQSTDGVAVRAGLDELTRANSPRTVDYWRRTRPGLGVPDSAYKADPPWLFPEEEPARVFRTSMTTGGVPGQVPYSARGLELMDLSIVTNARAHLMAGLDRPAVVRLVPEEAAAPGMVMAHGMALIARTFGHPTAGACVLTGAGIDLAGLRTVLDRAVAEQRPVVLIGATFAVVNLCALLVEEGLSWSLPPLSRVLDAGGSKGRAREVTVADLRAGIADRLGVPPSAHLNLFGMTELASQLYDAADEAVGPAGERPKARERFVRPIVRDPLTLEPLDAGRGLLEVVDLAALDRPCAVLTGDWAVAHPAGAAVTGRVERARGRGCSLALDAVSGQRVPA